MEKKGHNSKTDADGNPEDSQKYAEGEKSHSRKNFPVVSAVGEYAESVNCRKYAGQKQSRRDNADENTCRNGAQNKFSAEEHIRKSGGFLFPLCEHHKPSRQTAPQGRHNEDSEEEKQGGNNSLFCILPCEKLNGAYIAEVEHQAVKGSFCGAEKNFRPDRQQTDKEDFPPSALYKFSGVCCKLTGFHNITIPLGYYERFMGNYTFYACNYLQN